ncbi:MAG: lysophospholipase, partial [Desulfobacterales bacterium]|nr:lysophospholipase [Desulfobacterales bacterium]
MKLSEIRGKDGERVFIHNWGIARCRAQLIIAHGMGEHGGRYRELATHLNGQGISVYAPDHRGHGLTGERAGQMGHFASRNGWDRVVDDLLVLCRKILEDDGETPVFLMGHSMGSFLARDFASRHGRRLKGLILSGTAHKRMDALAGFLLTRCLSLFASPLKSGGMLTRMTLGKFNGQFAPNRTEYDWLSRDPDHVDAYVADPHCGIDFTLGFYRDLFTGLQRITHPAAFRNTPDDLPLLCFAGDEDPVGERGAGVRRAAQCYERHGNRDVTLKL